MNRRDFLKFGATSTAAAWTATVAPIPDLFARLVFAPPGQAPKGDILVCIFQRGGMDGLNVVAPLGDKAYYQARPTLAIPQPKSGDSKSAIDLDGFFGFNPALKPLKDVYDDGGLAIIHACGSPDPTHSHFDAMDYMERGTPGEKTLQTGWLARHLKSMASQNTSPFRAVGMGTMLPSVLRGPVPATALQSIAEFHLGGKTRLPQLDYFQKLLDQFYAGSDPLSVQADLTFQAMETLSRVDVNHYQPVGGASYPETDFGIGLKQIAQLIKSDIGLEVAAVDIGGWDTHVAQATRLTALLEEFGGGLAAFYKDMGELMKRVTVVTMSEFGRRVQENANDGTDHGHGNLMMVVSKNIARSKIYGDWPGLAPEKLAAPGDLAATTDFRDVLSEVVQKRLGNSHLEEVFPGYKDPKMPGIFI
jgi:uncharacterized protein (DUF1501 family)